MKTCAAFNTGREDGLIQSQNASPVELIAHPNIIKVGPDALGLLNITAKFKNSFMIEQ